MIISVKPTKHGVRIVMQDGTVKTYAPLPKPNPNKISGRLATHAERSHANKAF